MYGMKEEKPKKFAFDLENEIKAKPTHGQKLIDEAEKRNLEIKDLMRKGVESETDYDKLGILLHANAASQKVIKKLLK